jgi:hypothetical protein
MDLRGLPPFAPLAFAAATFAADVAFPPFRPSATAAGFLRAIDDGPVMQVDASPMSGEARIADSEVFMAVAHSVSSQGAEIGGAVGVRHTPIKPNRLGFVK